MSAGRIRLTRRRSTNCRNCRISFNEREGGRGSLLRGRGRGRGRRWVRIEYDWLVTVRWCGRREARGGAGGQRSEPSIIERNRL